jgi:hypothetical protein
MDEQPKNRLIDDDDYTDEEYRPPDESKICRLIDDGYANVNMGMGMDIETQYFNMLIQETKEKDSQISNPTLQEPTAPENKFKHTIMQLNKLSIFDNTNIAYYELILTIIEMYNNNYITEYIVSLDEYNKIFKILNNIRIPENEINQLKIIIIIN